MSVFGVTGNLSSGKSTVLKLLKRKGAIVFDVDKAIHAYYQDKNSRVYKQIVSLFSDVTSNRKIARKKLAKIVFLNQLQLINIAYNEDNWYFYGSTSIQDISLRVLG